MKGELPPGDSQPLDQWLAAIEASNITFQREAGAAKLGLFKAAAHVLAAPRLLRKRMIARPDRGLAPELQRPWLPRWPGLAAKPLHDPRDHPWTRRLRDAGPDIRRELSAVRARFARARYDSELNPKPWNTFYFFLQGRPVHENLAACPLTAALLREIPHNGFHVCFSAIAPGGVLHPHTGPTNASLTAHLGLANCAGARLWVAGETAKYRDDDVLVFDDSFVHRVDHDGTGVRCTLMITFWHPELHALERTFLRHVVQIAPR
jgi:aspartyl/asparaginyl beta-hydroxylase (cupin superfamily)